MSTRITRGQCRLMNASVVQRYARSCAAIPDPNDTVRPTGALTPGAPLGPYEIQSAVGAGGMGEVHKARDTRLDRTVAIRAKRPHCAGAATSADRAQCARRPTTSVRMPGRTGFAEEHGMSAEVARNEGEGRVQATGRGSPRPPSRGARSNPTGAEAATGNR